MEKGLGELLIPLIDVYNHPEEIDWDALPNEFALKLNVGCGCNLICTNKANLNIQETIKEIRKWEKEKVPGRMPFLFRKETEHSVFAFSMWHLEWHSE